MTLLKTDYVLALYNNSRRGIDSTRSTDELRLHDYPQVAKCVSEVLLPKSTVSALRSTHWQITIATDHSTSIGSFLVASTESNWEYRDM